MREPPSTWEEITLAVLKVDDRYRLVLDNEIREKLQVEPGDFVLALASTDGVLLTNLKGKRYDRLHPGFNYREEEHEASRFLFGKKRRKPKRAIR